MDPDIITFVMLSVLKCNAFYKKPTINNEMKYFEGKTR